MLDRRAVLAGLTAAPLAACATAPDRRGAREMRLATFNIWHNQGDWAARLPLLVEALRETDADVIGLQEVLEDAAVGLPNQARTIAAALGGYEVRFSSADAEGAPRRYGNAILSRLPVIASDWKKLEPLDDYRTAVRVRVDLGGRAVDVVNTHLAWQPDQAATRARQVADLMDWLPDDGTPLVVMGDFNAALSDPGLAVLTGPGFFSALPDRAAATTLNPAQGHALRVIDHIFAEAAQFVAVGAKIIGDVPTAGVHPSDHFGVAAILGLR